MNKIVASALLLLSASSYGFTNLDIKAIGNTFYAEGAITKVKKTPQMEQATPEVFSNSIFTSSR